ncbi:MAG: hypothetical protein IPL26_21210 [Leptospiraceae bacterium]|nr:hypothetical protein [Leptospiraceae bacterium]
MPNTKEIHTEVFVTESIEKIFNTLAVNGADFPKYFRGFFPLIPSIEEITIPIDTNIEVGLIRTVRLGDGSLVKERILEHNSPYSQTYEMAEMNSIQKLLFNNMIGKYTLKQKENQVEVNWDYTFLGKDTFLSRLLLPVVVWGFKKAMKSCLTNMKAFNEKEVKK